MPGGAHGLDDPSNDELATLGTAGSEEDMKVMLAVFPAFKLIENSIREGSEAMGTNKAAAAEELPIAVDNLRLGFKAILAAGTGDTLQVHDPRHCWAGTMPAQSLPLKLL